MAAVTGYVAWQVAPLSSRIDALMLERLEMQDRLLTKIERLAQAVDEIREPSPRFLPERPPAGKSDGERGP
ncbi:MAG: hypothetical protein ACREQ9_20245, partial [Candidatus Binatia bacterium]